MDDSEEVPESMTHGIPQASLHPKPLPPRHPGLVDAYASQALLITGPPGTGKSQMMTRVINECMARGDRVVVVSTGGGKARDSAWAAWARLSALHDAQKFVKAFQAEVARPAVSSAALLSTSEADNKLPTITSPSLLGEVDPRANHSRSGTGGLIEDLRRFLKALERPIQQLIRVMETLLGIRHFVVTGPAPPHATSPCGVIRFAAPMVPRAPGRDQPAPTTADYDALAA
ncbi:type IV secretion system DNA-binding domain-containing protein [Streptomyces antimycoticus]|uniref:type IV secretion system DNA-binding domain-containing protein n=1 Tax=Streptomyces antimycoticus TaxID=68175 RepID=UPI0036B3B3A0